MPRSSVVMKRGGKTSTVTKKVAVKKAVRKTSTRAKITKKLSAPDTLEHPLVLRTEEIAEIAKKIAPTTLIKRNPLGHLLIEKLLREAGFRGGISTKKDLLDKYSTDESIFSIRPQVVLQPRNRNDVEIATAVVAEQTKRFTSLSLTPRAAGTGLGGGSLTDSVVIDVCAHLDKIGDVVEKKDKIILSCEPGAMWPDIESRLKAHDAYLPPFPTSKDTFSIGGSIANNIAGPDSLRHGTSTDWVESIDIVLQDGHTYTIKPLTFREFKLLIKQNNEHARIAKEIFALIEKNETEIKKSKKSNAGFPLWNVVPQGVTKFKKNEGTFDLTRLICGSQGTIGIIVNITLRAEKIPKNTTLIAVPIFNLEDVSEVLVKAGKYNPLSVEVFDGLSFDLAMRNPTFFRERLSLTKYYRVMLSMYSMYHVRLKRRLPEFTALITIDEAATDETPIFEIADKISTATAKARIIKSPTDIEMLWQIRRTGYTLSKFHDQNKRPAAFLEDMTVPPENLSKFLVQIKRLLKEFNISTAIHSYGGNGNFYFYPLLDFNNKTTPAMVEKIAEKFFATATKFNSGALSEHNDSIISVFHLNKIFSKKMIELFETTEKIFDPNDIFNPGKKVHPRFDIKSAIRDRN